jgi:hypothetical protein
MGQNGVPYFSVSHFSVWWPKHGRLLDLDDSEAFQHAFNDIMYASMTLNAAIRRAGELLNTLRDVFNEENKAYRN